MAIVSQISRFITFTIISMGYSVLAVGVALTIHILSQLIVPKNPNEPPNVFSLIPVLGNAVQFGMNPVAFLQECQKKYGDVFTFTMVGKRVTVCLGADGNQFVFNSKQNLSSAAEAYNHMTKYVFGPDVVYDAPHAVFMEQKKFIKAGLNSDCFRQHVPMIVQETEEFFKKFNKPTGFIEAYETFGSLIIYTASRCLMGKEIRASLDGNVAKLYYDLDQGFKPINFIFPNLPLPSYRRRDVACKKMADLYSSIIQRRKDEKDNNNADLLQALMDATYKDGTHIPDHHIAGMMIAVLFGGQHTSATTSAWTILELANRPDIIKALREEQIEKLGSLKADLTFDNLKDLPLLEAAIRETLRLHPPIFQMMRRVVADKIVYEKNGMEIPKGNFICAAPGVTQVDPTYFNEPTTYNPYRWIEKTDPVHQLEQGDDANIDYGFGAVGISSKSPFLPFGAGRHRCIGEQFGYLQLKTVISTFIRTFDFDLDGKSVPKSDYTSMVVVPEHTAKVRYTWRE
uniref:Lanosterol 14-alpha demethylase n=1 Tax=Cunninghamella elegans TaxID=4853 RepID=CP51_CUNEL|nr:RecName: Full=Lanosterol 14-alpha demethylase; AltName: Full=CYPLI; AltName: Full=Cytochrome P450 51; AltName: Full=Cytochrome P450-14DM; AltName: Full=Cytochrome P450-LIA1; AltName: Full=Sterol 14-alpha demethylase [Cunninghamella elegans]AAF20263.1 cytochrome P450 [Cunninghamella elegans]